MGELQYAVVGNVGSLIEPVTAATYELSSARVPPRLYSHDDQQDSLGGQLAVVAMMIAARESFRLKRQIFFVADNGYDTHSNQTSCPSASRACSRQWMYFTGMQ